MPLPRSRPATGRRMRMPRTVVALMLREMATTYGRSPGGYLWAVVEPVAALVMLSLLFQVFLRTPQLGTNFLLFYATGFLPFGLFNNIANKMATAIRFSRPLLAYPSVTYFDAMAARFLLTLLTQILVFYIIFAGILVLYDTRAQLAIPSIIEAVVLTAVLGFGVGSLNCYLMTAFPVWERTWQIITRPLFLVSCIFFLFEDVPRAVRDFLWFNPLVHVIGLMRRGFYPTYDADYVSTVYVVLVATATTMAGLFLLRRYYRDLLQN